MSAVIFAARQAHMMKPAILAAACMAVTGLSCGAARAQVFIDGTQYGTTGSTENLSATFTTPDGGVTTGLYDNYVEITVSGTGMSYATNVNDAFYVLTGGPAADPDYYQLTFGTTTLVAFDPSQDIKNFIAYDLLANTAVTAPYVPAYEADNTYSFIIDTGAVSLTSLHFGVGDGNFTDNSGAYQIAVTQLAAIPEPGSLLLLGVGAVTLGLGWRRKAIFC
jgi:hypothetical protein